MTRRAESKAAVQHSETPGVTLAPFGGRDRDAATGDESGGLVDPTVPLLPVDDDGLRALVTGCDPSAGGAMRTAGECWCELCHPGGIDGITGEARRAAIAGRAPHGGAGRADHEPAYRFALMDARGLYLSVLATPEDPIATPSADLAMPFVSAAEARGWAAGAYGTAGKIPVLGFGVVVVGRDPSAGGGR